MVGWWSSKLTQMSLVFLSNAVSVGLVKRLNNNIKIRLYESLILSTLLYAAKSWPMTTANMKKLETAHHKWQRKILGITWQDRVTKDEVRRRTGMLKLEYIVRKRILR